MDFVVIANRWSAGIDNPTSKHRIALELARQGHRVLWVEGSGMRVPSVGSSADRLRMLKKLGGALRGARRVGREAIWVSAPLFVPIPSVRWIRALNGWIGAGVMRRQARRLGFKDPVLINYVPVLADAIRHWKGQTVYYCVDRWDAFAMYDSAMMAEMDERCCRSADIVITTSRDLYERSRKLNPRTSLVMHGVDYAHFASAVAVPPPPRPADLPAGKIVGFFGLLSEWLDQDLVVRLARDLPDAQVVLIGPADVPIERLRNIANLHLLGPRPFRALPPYIAHFDVGIIPFLVDELTRAVNPIKLREMLAAGCPVVSTALPEVERYAGASSVSVAHNHEEFVAQVRRRLARPINAGERRQISAAMAGETWDVNVREILSLIGAAKGVEP